MDVYIYQAALLCEDCGLAVKQQLDKRGEGPEDPDDEESYDSDEYPKGPYADGGGEADVPNHCDMGGKCLNADVLSDGRRVGAFLENQLTGEGEEYVVDAVKDAVRNRPGKASVALEIWKPFYDGLQYEEDLDPDEIVRVFLGRHPEHEDGVDAVFEHQQWWVVCNNCGGQWSVADEVRGRWGFEEVTTPNESCLDED